MLNLASTDVLRIVYAAATANDIDVHASFVDIVTAPMRPASSTA